MRSRRGFALLAVLWVSAALAVVSLTVLLDVDAELQESASRAAWLRGHWAAEACLSLSLARLHATIEQSEALAIQSDTVALPGRVQCAIQAVDPEAFAGSDRLNLNVAPESLISRLPGMTEQAARLIADTRTWRPLAGLQDLIDRLPADDRQHVMSHYAQLITATSFRTSSLNVMATGWLPAGRPVTIRAHVAAAGDRIAVLERRMQ